MRRTTATTDYLKECMGTALLELMKEKPIEKISIEEMTAAMLEDVIMMQESTAAYRLVTYGQLCHYVNGMRSRLFRK